MDNTQKKPRLDIGGVIDYGALTTGAIIGLIVPGTTLAIVALSVVAVYQGLCALLIIGVSISSYCNGTAINGTTITILDICEDVAGSIITAGVLTTGAIIGLIVPGTTLAIVALSVGAVVAGILALKTLLDAACARCSR